MVLGMTKEELQEWTTLIFEGSGSRISFGQRIALRQWRDSAPIAGGSRQDGVVAPPLSNQTIAAAPVIPTLNNDVTSAASTSTSSSSTATTTAVAAATRASVPPPSEDNTVDVPTQEEEEEHPKPTAEHPAFAEAKEERSGPSVEEQIRARLDAIEKIMMDGDVFSDMEEDSDSSWVTDSSASGNDYDEDDADVASTIHARSGKLRARQARIEYVSGEDTGTEESSEPDSDSDY
jgi:hypothetical protein